MKILALEFSCDERSVAVLDSARGEAREVLENGGRSVKAFSAIDTTLHLTRIERESIDCLAVGLGPGSYTGIRAAIAVAQGWQLARDVKVIGIGACETLTAQAQAADILGVVNFVIDAQRGEFYAAKFQIEKTAVRELASLRLATRAEVQTCLDVDEIVVGPEVTKWFANGRKLVPSAATLAKLALTRTDFVAAEKLEPIYLRETTFVKAAPPRII